MPKRSDVLAEARTHRSALQILKCLVEIWSCELWVSVLRTYLRHRCFRGIYPPNMAYSRYWILAQRHCCIDWIISGHSPAQRDTEGHCMGSGRCWELSKIA